MSGILGYVRFDGAPAGEEHVSPMAQAVLPRGRPSFATAPSGDAVLGALTSQNEHHGSGADEATTLADGTLVVSDSRIDAVVPVGRPGPGSRPPHDTGHIAAVLEHRGSDLIHHLVGDFAFAAWQPRHRTLILGRDSMAMRPLLYHRSRNGAYFASEAGQLREALGRPGPVNASAVAAFLAGDELPPNESFYEDLSRVPPGSVVSISGTTETTEVRRSKDVVPQGITEEEATEEFWVRFQTAVRDRTERFSQYGLMLSGGADSTAIGVALKEIRSANAAPGRAYTWAFEELEDGDEQAAAQTVADLAGISLAAVAGDDVWPLKDAPEHGPDDDAPFVWPFQALNDRTLTRARLDGARTVLTGDRGDAVVGDWVFESGQPVARPAPPPYLDKELAERIQERRSDTALGEPTSANGMRCQRIFGWSAGQIAEMNSRAFWRKGLVYSDPWSDVRIADWVLGLPPAWVNRPEERKRILRRALAARGFDPNRLSTQEPAGLFERGLRNREVHTVKSLFKSPLSGDLGYVDPQVVRKAYARYVAHGSLPFDLWKPIALELWLRRIHGRRDSP